MTTFDWNMPEVAAAAETPDRCTMFKGNFLFGTYRCENASTQTVTMACVHEHVAQLAHCAECAEALTAEPYFCNRCTDSSQPHECPVTVTIAPREVPS